MNEYEYISKKVPEGALLCQIAEEAADVQLALDVWKVKYNQDGDAADDAIESTVDIKRGRWIRRLKEKTS